MTIWEILGIEPTYDTSIIKKAYAQKLKIYHPEDDPEGFQKLKEAYDAAIKRAKLMKKETQVVNTASSKPATTFDNCSNSIHQSHFSQTDTSSKGNKPDENKQNEIKHDETKPNQTKPNQTKSNEIKYNETKNNELKPNDSPPESAQQDDNEHHKNKPGKSQPINDTDENQAGNNQYNTEKADDNQPDAEKSHTKQLDVERIDAARPDTGQSGSDQSDAEQVDINKFNYNENQNNKVQDYENINGEDQLNEEAGLNNTIETNEELIRCMEELYNDFPRRIDVSYWTELMNSPILWKIGNKDSLSGAVLIFLGDHPNLPWDILKLLDDHFKLNTTYNYPNVDYDHSSIKYILMVLNLGKGLSFSYLNEGSGYDLEKFLNLRQLAFMFMCQDRNQEAVAYALKAQELYRRDLELLYILGYCHTCNGNHAAALKALGTVLSINPSHEGALYLRGKLHFEKEEYKYCIAFLLEIKKHPENYKDRPIMLAKSYLQIRYYSSARTWFLNALEEHPSDLPLKKLLLSTDEHIISRYNWKRLKKKLTKEDIVEHGEVKAELKLFQKEGFISGPVGKIAMMLVWGIVATFFVFVFLARPLSPSSKTSKPPKAITPAASTHTLSNGEIEARLLNASIYQNTDLGEVCYLKVLKKLKLRLNPMHPGFLPSENSDDNMSNKNSDASIYLAEYNGKKIIIAMSKVDSDLGPQFTTVVGHIFQFNFSGSSNAINDALAAANLDATNLYKDMFLSLLVPPNIYESLPQ